MKDKIEVMVKSTTATIVTINITFSAPRRVWIAESKLSAEPKAPPAPADEYCNRIPATTITERIIWTYGSTVVTALLIEEYGSK